MGAAEIRAAILNIGSEVLGSEFTVDILSEEDNTIVVQCAAATGELVYQMDSQLMYKIIRFCEVNNMDFSADDMDAKTPGMEDWI